MYFFIINFFSWKTAFLKACHSPSYSSFMIIAREEYVTPSNVTSVFFSKEVSQGCQLRVTLSFEKCLIISKKSWVKNLGCDNKIDYLT